jgi:hypothetical protein
MSPPVTVEFTEEAIQDYLDNAIRVWRRNRDNSRPGPDLEMAQHYIDAFQSVRTSLFGETLVEL